jgi:hypothetical protein
MNKGDKVRFKSTGRYASVHMKGHRGTVVGNGDPLHTECPPGEGAIDVKCDTCERTHYTFEHYVSIVKERAPSAG